MAKEICISSTPHETRLAILEDDQLAEIYYERENEYTLAGSIYNGRVTFISSEAEFTPKQIQTQQERVKLVYRVKIELENPKHELKSNMPADAEIVLEP